MQCIQADPGCIFVSADLSAGEPTITTHFSGDPMYFAANFGMVGKEPYYDNGLLMIDDIYLMVMSVSPIGKQKMKDKFGPEFVTQWMLDKEVVQKQWLKRDREIHKILALGLAYGLSSPKSMAEHAAKAGYSITHPEARAFKKAYWELFGGVETFSRKLIRNWERDGHVINPFGYRCVPDADYKVMNAFIQSSVSGLMNLLCIKFFTACPEADYIATIHDEVIFQVPENQLTRIRTIWNAAVDSLNQDLSWTVKIRTGFATGKTFYEAK